MNITLGHLIALLVLIIAIIGMLVALPAWADLGLIAALALAVLLGTIPVYTTRA